MTPVVARLCAGQRRISLKAKSFTLAPLRYIGPGDAAADSDFALGKRCGVKQPVAQDDDLAFPFIQHCVDAVDQLLLPF